MNRTKSNSTNISYLCGTIGIMEHKALQRDFPAVHLLIIAKINTLHFYTVNPNSSFTFFLVVKMCATSCGIVLCTDKVLLSFSQSFPFLAVTKYGQIHACIHASYFDPRKFILASWLAKEKTLQFADFFYLHAESFLYSLLDSQQLLLLFPGYGR